jgi:hypothetical protein
VGDRQDSREADIHVMRVVAEEGAIIDGIRKQLCHGRYDPSTLYGDGYTAQRIVTALASLTPYVQKRLAYASAKDQHLVYHLRRGGGGIQGYSRR